MMKPLTAKEIKAIIRITRDEMKGDTSPYARGWRKALQCAQDDLVKASNGENVEFYFPAIVEATSE